MISTLLHFLPVAQIVLILVVGIRKLNELVATWRKTPRILRFAVVALLILGALIPGPFDDLVIAVIIVKLGANKRAAVA